jgi:two-component system response regulator HydG
LFREDLFYRLNVVSIHVPPLRDRREDIPLLIDHFLQLYNQKRGASVLGLSDRARDRLMAYDWPGNVRELVNLVERLVVLSGRGVIDAEDLAFCGWPKSRRSKGGNGDGDGDRGGEGPLALRDMEKEHIRRVLDLCGGHKSDAAQTLGIDRKTLREKIKRYGL